ncbi:hypothetical protein BG015_006740 [Linnemannia schmuckeri]|uniref:FAD-binding domain-containing protein n=1 Tax=Linnemannia schmuckeri TaxID=64567 RepID=A0A9P5S2Z5_9FUNG|nr:hypothetical protein BG015_006740 [Linnemannia schmuckeri]
MHAGGRRVGTLPVMGTSTEDTEFNYGLLLEQEKTSQLLFELLKELGVNVEYGWELVDTKVVEARADENDGEETYVETVIRRALLGDNTAPEDNMLIGGVDMYAEQENKEYETQTVRSKYLVACDGGRSTVRHKLDIGFSGRTLEHKTLMWDGICETNIVPNGITAVTGTNNKTMIILPLTNGLTRISVEAGPLSPTEDISQTLRELTVERFEALAQEAAHPSTFKVLSTTWLTCFKINERRADQFVYKNRIFLAGDAAHIHSPAGGQGLNTGLQDAHNLAWKLAFVLNGLVKNEGEVLETYREREAMADRAIDVSSKLLQRNRDNRLIARMAMKVLFTVGPLIAKCFKSFSFAPDVSMLKVRYHENVLNRPHDSQPVPAADYQVGVRAQDGVISPIATTTSSITDEKSSVLTSMRLHDLFIGLARFHILIFASDTHLSSATALTLAHNATNFVNQWRAKYTYTSTLQDGYTDKDLFKFHFLITSTSASISTEKTIQSLSQRQIGEGKVFLDDGSMIHKKYGFEAGRGSEEGGIVVLRPDSHIGYRVNGLQDQAWKDVDQFLSSILASQLE